MRTAPPDLIVCGAFLKGAAMELCEAGEIRIRGADIVSVGDASDAGAERCDPGCARRMEFPGCLILPGLVNAHVHLRDAVAAEAASGQALSRAVMGPDSIRARAIADASRTSRIAAMREALEEMARLGISLVGDFCDGGAQGVQEVREAAAGLPIDVVVLGRLFESTRGISGTIESLAPDQRAELGEVLDLADGFAAATVNSFGDAAWNEIAGLARDRGKLLAVHAAEDADHTATSLAATGRTDVDRAIGLGVDHVVHLTSATENMLRRVIASRTPVVCCPRSNALTGAGWPPISELLAAGACVCLGTDNLMLNSGNLWREVEYTAKVACALARDPAAVEPRALLVAATRNGARALRKERQHGMIEAGQRAHLVVIRVDGPPMTFARDRLSAIVHRLEPGNVAGRFFNGRSVPSIADR